jgi:hypothetical protein
MPAFVAIGSSRYFPPEVASGVRVFSLRHSFLAKRENGRGAVE